MCREIDWAERVLDPPDGKIIECIARQCKLRVEDLRKIYSGWDVIAVEFQSGLLVRLPKTPDAWRKMCKEKVILDHIRDGFPCALPKTELISGSVPFSCHTKIPGPSLDEVISTSFLSKKGKALEESLVVIIKHLHSINFAPLEEHLPVYQVFGDTVHELVTYFESGKWNHIVGNLRKALGVLSEQPKQVVFSHFDLHGANMTVDLGSGSITGLYDFLDSALGDPAHDLSKIVKIDLDLARRVHSVCSADGIIDCPFNIILAYAVLEQFSDIRHLGLRRELAENRVTQIMRLSESLE